MNSPMKDFLNLATLLKKKLFSIGPVVAVEYFTEQSRYTASSQSGERKCKNLCESFLRGEMSYYYELLNLKK